MMSPTFSLTPTGDVQSLEASINAVLEATSVRETQTSIAALNALCRDEHEPLRDPQQYCCELSSIAKNSSFGVGLENLKIAFRTHPKTKAFFNENGINIPAQAHRIEMRYRSGMYVRSIPGQVLEDVSLGSFYAQEMLTKIRDGKIRPALLDVLSEIPDPATLAAIQNLTSAAANAIHERCTLHAFDCTLQTQSFELLEAMYKTIITVGDALGQLHPRTQTRILKQRVEFSHAAKAPDHLRAELIDMFCKRFHELFDSTPAAVMVASMIARWVAAGVYAAFLMRISRDESIWNHNQYLTA